jgi:dihydrofolate synthase/folylpolyglutamate synthase
MSASLAPFPMNRPSPRQFLAGRIDYERTHSMPSSEAELKLDRMRDLLRRLGNPHHGLRVVHLAGTKGKGSTAAMIAAILSAAGYRTGLFTSPHLEKVEERIVIDGRLCPPDEFDLLIELVRPAVEAMDRELAALRPPELGPTYFEILTAMALLHFARRKADAAVLEVGLGGRLDSTNVTQPAISLITSISLDHTRQLGDTLESIAAEKAGIIKPGVPVVSGAIDPGPREVIRRAAKANGCLLKELGVDFDFQYHPPRHLELAPAPAEFDYFHLVPGECSGGRAAAQRLSLSMPGRHQAANAALAVAAVEELKRQGWNISDEAVHRGLAGVVSSARVEVVRRRPTVVLDAAHNAASVSALMETLDESFSAARRLLIFAASAEKDLEGMLRLLLGRFDRVLFTRYLENPRAVPPDQLLAIAQTISPLPLGEGPGVNNIYPLPLGEETGVRAEKRGEKREERGEGASGLSIAPTPADAWAAARRWAQADDLICITGSFFLAAELRKELVT